MDLVSQRHGSVLHVIDVETRFQGGGFINKLDEVSTWKHLRKVLIEVYTDASDYIFTEAGTNFISEQFKSSAKEHRTIVRVTQTKAHDRIRKVERSHAYMRTVYKELCVDLPGISREDRLSLIFRSLYDMSHVNSGICAATLVFGVYPKIHGARDRGALIQRAAINRKCTSFKLL